MPAGRARGEGWAGSNLGVDRVPRAVGCQGEAGGLPPRGGPGPGRLRGGGGGGVIGAVKQLEGEKGGGQAGGPKV